MQTPNVLVLITPWFESYDLLFVGKGVNLVEESWHVAQIQPPKAASFGQSSRLPGTQKGQACLAAFGCPREAHGATLLHIWDVSVSDFQYSNRMTNRPIPSAALECIR